MKEEIVQEQYSHLNRLHLIKLSGKCQISNKYGQTTLVSY